MAELVLEQSEIYFNGCLNRDRLTALHTWLEFPLRYRFHGLFVQLQPEATNYFMFCCKRRSKNILVSGAKRRFWAEEKGTTRREPRRSVVSHSFVFQRVLRFKRNVHGR